MNEIKETLSQGGWNITYDEFHIDFSVPCAQQLNELNEDLLQASANNFIIDIGWYPEGDPEGKIISLLIKDHNWQKPILHFEDTNYADFKKHICLLTEYGE